MKKILAVLMSAFFVLSCLTPMSLMEVAAADDTVLFEETFGSAVSGSADYVAPQALSTSNASGYGNWRVNVDANTYQTAVAAGTEINIITDPENDSNNIVHFKRTTIGTGNDNPQVIAGISMPSYSATDSVVLSFKMKADSNYHNIGFDGLLPYLHYDYVVMANGHKFTPADDDQIAALKSGGVWHNYEFIVNYTAGTTTLFVDDIQIGDAYEGTVNISKLQIYQPRGENSGKGNIYFDDIKLVQVPDPEYVTYADILNGQDASEVTGDLNLFTTKGDKTFEWASDKPGVITNAGVVTRPSSNDTKVTLSVTVKETATGTTLANQTFTVTVLKASTAGVTETVLYKENFGSAVSGATNYVAPQPIATSKSEGYGDWFLQSDVYEAAKLKGTEVNIIVDSQDASNNVLHFTRAVKSSDADNPNLVACINLPTYPKSESVVLRFKMKFDGTKHRVGLDGSPAGWLRDDFVSFGSATFTPSGSDQSSAMQAPNEWHNYEVVINYTMNTTTLYIDGYQIGAVYSGTIDFSQLAIYQPRAESYGQGNVWFDDFKLVQITKPVYVTESDILNGQNASSVTKALNLFTTKDGNTVEWTSSHPSVISTSGAVTQSTTQATTVTLTATVKNTSGETLGTYTFTVTVPKAVIIDGGEDEEEEEEDENHNILFKETFGSAVSGSDDYVAPQALSPSSSSGYGNWRVNVDANMYQTAVAAGTEINIIADPEKPSNNIVQFKRTTSGTASSNPQVWVSHSLPAHPVKDKVVLSFKMKFENSTHNVMFDTLINALRYDGIWMANGHQYTPANDEQKAAVNEANVWHKHKFVIDFTAGITTLYIDGIQIGDPYNGTMTVSTLNILQPRGESSAKGNVYMDDIKLVHIPDPEVLTFADIANGQKSASVTRDLNLFTTKGVYTIDWVSNKPSVISNAGKVTRPTFIDEVVTLTAKATLTATGEEVVTRSYAVTVPTESEVLWSDDFESGAVDADLIVDYETGVNGWTLATDSFAGDTPSTLEKAKQDGTLLQFKNDPSGEEGKALYVVKKISGRDTANWIATKTLDATINSGMVYFSTRIYPVDAGSRFYFEPFGYVYPSQISYLAGFNNGAAYMYTDAEKALWKPQQWNILGFLMNFDDHTVQLYINSEPVGQTVVMGQESLSKLRLYMPRTERAGEFYVDDMQAKVVTLTDQQSVDRAVAALTLDVPSDGVTENIVLPTAGSYSTAIAWKVLTNEGIIDPLTGTVTRPIGDDVTVSLEATVSKNNISATKVFNVVVKGRSVLNAEVNALSFSSFSNGQTPGEVTQKLNLATSIEGIYTTLNIEWESSNTAIIAKDGTVNLPDYYTVVTLTAKIKAGGSETMNKEFVVGVPGRGQTIFGDGFESDEYEVGQRITGRNGWVQVLYTPHGHEITLEKDPSDETNHVFYMDAFATASNNSNLLNEYITHGFDKQASGLVSISWRFRLNNANNTIGFELCKNMDSDIFVSEVSPSSWYFETGVAGTGTRANFSTLALKTWHTAEMLIDFDRGTVNFSINGTVVKTDAVRFPDFSAIRFKRPRFKAIQDWYLDDILIRKLDVSDNMAVSEASDSLVITSPVTENFILPKQGAYGTEITWRISDESLIEVVDNLAVVHRAIGVDKTVTLTATISRATASVEKEFRLVLPAISAAENAASALEFNSFAGNQKSWFITESFTLPNSVNGASVEWTSSVPGVLDKNGNISRQRQDVPVTLTATFTKDGSTYQKTFDLVVVGAGTVISVDDFSAPSTEGQDIHNWNNWSLEDTTGYLNGIKATVEKDPFDGLTSYDEAEKVLSFNRYNLKNDGKVYNQMVMKKIDASKKEITRVDFDYMFHVVPSTMYVEMEGMLRHYGISNTGIGLKGYDEIPFGKTLEAYKWYHITIEQDAYNNTFNVYLDYEKLNDEPVYAPGNATITGVNFYSNGLTATVKESFMVRRLVVRDITTDPALAVSLAKDALTLGAIDYTTGKIALPVGGIENTSISWSSSNEDVISNEGVVTRAAANTNVTLTATIFKGETSVTKEFPYTVLATSGTETATEEILNIIAADITEASITDEPRFRLTKDLVLPSEITTGRAADIGGVTINWSSNYPLIITADGKLTQQPYEMPVTLTATVTSKLNPAVSVTKDLKFAVNIGGTVIHHYDFEDMSESKKGEDIESWTSILKRAAGADVEYGNQFFADKEPEDSGIPFDKANKVLFLNRYTNSGYDYVAGMSHTRIVGDKQQGYFRGDVLSISYRVKFSSPRQNLEMSTYCLAERYINFSPSTLSINGGTLGYTFQPALTVGEWHDIVLYYDTISFRMDVYVDGEHIVSEPLKIPTSNMNYLEEWRFFNANMGYIIIDDLLLRSVPKPKGDDVVAAAVAATTVPETVTEDLDLANRYGRCSITWRSSDESVISDTGRINPSLTQAKRATLTATFRNGSVVETKKFNVTVPAQTSFDKEFAIESINLSGDRVTGVTVKRLSNVSASAKLFVVVYDQDAFSGLYRYDMPAMQTGASQTIATDISLADFMNYKVKAYVWDPEASSLGPISNYCVKEEIAR